MAELKKKFSFRSRNHVIGNYATELNHQQFNVAREIYCIICRFAWTVKKLASVYGTVRIHSAINYYSTHQNMNETKQAALHGFIAPHAHTFSSPTAGRPGSIL